MIKILLPVFLSLIVGVSACSSSSKRTVETKTTYSEPTYDSAGNLQVPAKTVTTTEVEEKKKDPSIVGSGLNFIGNVILFPFRLIGSVLGLIF